MRGAQLIGGQQCVVSVGTYLIQFDSDAHTGRDDSAKQIYVTQHPLVLAHHLHVALEHVMHPAKDEVHATAHTGGEGDQISADNDEGADDWVDNDGKFVTYMFMWTGE